MSMKVKLWGVRGSLPSPLLPSSVEDRMKSTLESFVEYQKDFPKATAEEYLNSLSQFQKGGYGGNTACTQVSSAKQSLIIDAGSGIRRLGEQLMAGPCGKGQGEVHLLFTHFHWDHVIGLPFFIPIFIPGNNIHLYSVSEGLEECVKRMFKKPNFPVPFERLASTIHFHELEPRKKVKFQDISVTPYQLDHPDPCWGYRFEKGKKAFSYCVDTEGIRVSREDLGPDLPLYQNVDLMVFDAQYTFLEATEKIDWGHASAPIGLDLAMREKIKKVLFIHHDPAATDEKVASAEEQTRAYYNHLLSMAKKMKKKVAEVDWSFAHEGTEVEV